MIDRARDYPYDEEGGVLVGYFEDNAWNPFSTYNEPFPSINLINFIPSGPRTQRTATSLFSDLEYQEYEFDRLKELDPRIEHLGSWHSHNCNGLKELSDGDIRSYFNIVESLNHSHDYYFAILLHGDPTRYVTCDNEVFHSFRFYGISRKTGKRLFTLDQSCIKITRNPILYSEFLHSGYTLPDELHRRERISNAWYRGSPAKEILKEDNEFFADIVRQTPLLLQRMNYVSEGLFGFTLTRHLQFNNLEIYYRYPEYNSDEGISILVNARHNKSSDERNSILEIAIKPIEIRHILLELLLECIKGGDTGQNIF